MKYAIGGLALSIMLSTGLAVSVLHSDAVKARNHIVGHVGPRGAAGADGADGTNGTNGIDGADGAIGERGFTGSDGATGSQGLQGERGFQGLTGPTGPMGPSTITPGPYSTPTTRIPMPTWVAPQPVPFRP